MRLRLLVPLLALFPASVSAEPPDIPHHPDPGLPRPGGRVPGGWPRARHAAGLGWPAGQPHVLEQWRGLQPVRGTDLGRAGQGGGGA